MFQKFRVGVFFLAYFACKRDDRNPMRRTCLFTFSMKAGIFSTEPIDRDIFITLFKIGDTGVISVVVVVFSSEI